MEQSMGSTALQRESRRVLSAGTLTADPVRNAQGEDLGKIEEIMIDLETGAIAYAVLSFGGFLGLGDKLFAIPWNALEVDEVNHELVLNVDRDTLDKAPGFDKDNWPDMADPAFETLIHNHFSAEPSWERRTPASSSYGRRTLASSVGETAGMERIQQPDLPEELRRKGIDVTNFPGRSKDDDLKTADPSRTSR